MEETISIEGMLVMLDDATPHVAVPVQAIRDGEVMATTLSDERGGYRFINLRPGQYQLRCRVLGGYVYYRATSHALHVTRYEEATSQQGTEEHLGESLRLEHGGTIRDIDFRFARFKEGSWRNYDGLNGLPHQSILAVHRSPGGVMWFGTRGGGVCRYDGKTFVNFTTKDGLVGDQVLSIHSDPDGVTWFGIDGGVSRYDGRGVTMGDFPHFVNLTTEHGLSNNGIAAIYHDSDVLWFGTEGIGIAFTP